MKWNIKVITLFLCTFLLTGCTTNPMAAIYNDNDKIASDTNSYNLGDVMQEIKDGTLTAYVERLEGMDTIWSYTSETEQEIDITYHFNVYSGKIKMVLISPNGEVNTIAEYKSEMKEPIQSVLTIKSGENRIKLVGDLNTKFDIQVSILQGEFKEIGFK